MKNKRINHIGEKWMTNEGYESEIIDWINNTNCTIRLNDSRQTILYGRIYYHVKEGTIKNPYHPSVFGIGYKGEGRHKTKVNKKMTKMYYVWVDMIRRSYRSEELGKDISYVDVSVCDEWFNFQVFGDWFETKFDYTTDDVWHLDKDILVKGNKIYSPETCSFVPREINNAVIIQSKGNLPPGVYREGGKYKAKIRIEGKSIPLGSFDTKEEAFNAYKVTKEKRVKELANKWKGKIEDEVYKSMMIWTIEITD